MKRLLLVVAALCSLGVVYAQLQTATIISGKLKNGHSGETIAGASVRLKKLKAGTISDSEGNFRLTVSDFPVMLIISHVNFEQQEIRISSPSELNIQMTPVSGILEEVEFKAKVITNTLLKSTYAADRIGLKKIRHSPSTSAYDNIVYVPGLDFTTAGLMFKTPSSRGFNGSGSSRVNQIVDGMDNQAPGLNFFIANFAGVTELDFESIELLIGASSALYGPGGMNGTILINSKDPFKHQGLSVMVKQGIMHLGKSARGQASAYNDYSLRWAHAFKNRLAIKISTQYLSADDWLASDSTNYQRSLTSGQRIAGDRMSDPNYNGVNVYGDETTVDIRPFIQGAIQNNPALTPILSPFLANELMVSRTGFQEKDIIDPKTKNFKLSGALHYKLSNKIEAQLMANHATGNTVYTDDDRYALKGVKISQYKVELKHKNWFIRGYTTQENAGEAYAATVTSQLVNEAWKSSYNKLDPPGSWYPQYLGAFATGAAEIYQTVMLSGGTEEQAKAAVLNAAPALHQAGRSFADRDRPAPGSAQFKQLFDVVRGIPIHDGGLFKEKSQLWMAEGQYTFGDANKTAEFVVGGNYKRYVLNSEGTLFIDTLQPIRINETGTYLQVTRKLFNEKLTLVGSGRYDKNENFKAQFTPRFAALIKLAENNNLRMSYQTAYRFPGNLAQWIRLNPGGGFTLLGGLSWIKDFIHAEKHPVYEIKEVPSTSPYQFQDLKPETMRSFEIGYKGLIQNRILIDAYAYIGKYQRFLGRIGLYQPSTDLKYSIVVNSGNSVKTHGYGLGLAYQLQNNFALFFNAYSDVITDVPNDFKAYFNTAKYRLNAGFSNSGFGKSKRFSFNIMMRWQDAFEWEGELANGPVKAFTTIDAQVSYTLPKIKSTFRLGGTNILNHYYQNAYGNPQVGGLYYVMYAYNLFK